MSRSTCNDVSNSDWQLNENIPDFKDELLDEYLEMMKYNCMESISTYNQTIQILNYMLVICGVSVTLMISTLGTVSEVSFLLFTPTYLLIFAICITSVALFMTSNVGGLHSYHKKFYADVKTINDLKKYEVDTLVRIYHSHVEANRLKRRMLNVSLFLLLISYITYEYVIIQIFSRFQVVDY